MKKNQKRFRVVGILSDFVSINLTPNCSKGRRKISSQNPKKKKKLDSVMLTLMPLGIQCVLNLLHYLFLLTMITIIIKIFTNHL